MLYGARAFAGRLRSAWGWAAVGAALVMGQLHLGVVLTLWFVHGTIGQELFSTAPLSVIMLYAAGRTLAALLRPGVTHHLDGS